jgi:hypothetical protein
MPTRYIIYCDESDDKGQFFSNFYGGVLILASRREAIEAELQALKNELRIFDGEMKWQRITENYADKYVAFVDKVFDIVERGDTRSYDMIKDRVTYEYDVWEKGTDHHY